MNFLLYFFGFTLPSFPFGFLYVSLLYVLSCRKKLRNHNYHHYQQICEKKMSSSTTTPTLFISTAHSSPSLSGFCLCGYLLTGKGERKRKLTFWKYELACFCFFVMALVMIVMTMMHGIPWHSIKIHKTKQKHGKTLLSCLLGWFGWSKKRKKDKLG